MKAKLLVGAVAGAGGWTGVGGDDIWKSKPYEQWDAKDVAALMHESPWTRANVPVTGNWSPDDTSRGPINVSQDKNDMNHVNGGRPDATLGDSSAKPAPPAFTGELCFANAT